MLTTQYLEQIIAMQGRIRAKSDEIKRIRQLATSISVSNEPDKVQTSSSKEKMADKVALLVDLEREVTEEVQRMVAKRKIIVEQIENLERPTESTILYLKFVDDKSFDDIAPIINYSRIQTIRIYKRALVDFEQKYGEMYLK